MIGRSIFKGIRCAKQLVYLAAGKAFSSKYLLLTNVLISTGMSGSADSLVQKTCRRYGIGNEGSGGVDRWDKIDTKRVGRLSVAGFVAGGTGHYWYIFLDKMFLGSSPMMVVKKTLLDQLFFAPVGIVMFFLLVGGMEGAPLRTIKSEMKKKGPEALAVEWGVYIPAQCINFTFLPTRFRVLYDNIVAFALELYYSHMKYER